jgi:mono/diheme cytochrome c family protein
VANDVVLTTTFDGVLWALDRETGRIVWRGQLPAGTNATVAVAGDWLVTAASYPQTKAQKAQIIALRIGGPDKLPAPAETPGAGGGGQGGGADQGGGGGGGGGGDQGGGGQEQPSDAQLAAGKQVFTGNCGSCHTLADARTSGSVGPNLDQLQPSADGVEQQVRNGGGGMPAFEGRLSDDQIANVSAYVAQVADPNAEGGGAGSGP